MLGSPGWQGRDSEREELGTGLKRGQLRTWGISSHKSIPWALGDLILQKFQGLSEKSIFLSFQPQSGPSSDVRNDIQEPVGLEGTGKLTGRGHQDAPHIL